MNEWKEIKLGDLLNFRRGHDLPKTSMLDGTIPVVGSNGIIGFHNIFTTKAPCLTIGRSGNIGNPCYINQDCWAHNTTLYIDNFKNNDSKYIYYLLKNMDLKHYGGGSAVPTLNRNHIHPVMVKSTNCYYEQKSIADTLSCLDDKIELNNQINKRLEEMAQAIFKSWFVDFEFPNEEGLPYQSSGGEMINSELGVIPNKWEKGRTIDMGAVLTGKTPPTIQKEFYGNDIPFIKTPDMHGNIYITTVENKLSLKGAEYQNNKYIPKNSVIMSCIGAKAGVVSLTSELSQTNQQINAIICEWPYYIYYTLKKESDNLRNIGSSGSTMININKSTFENYKILIPNLPILNKFNEKVQFIFDMILNNQNQNRNLEILRDSLLPKLMSGEIRVPLNEV